MMEAILAKYEAEYDEINGLWLFPNDAMAIACLNHLQNDVLNKEFRRFGDSIMEQECLNPIVVCLS